MTGTIRTDLSNDAYHADTSAISKSGLDLINISAAHFYTWRLDPDGPAHKETKAKTVGSAFHCAILEPEKFDQLYVIEPDDAPKKPTAAQWKAKKPSEDSVRAMDYWREFNEKNKGKTTISKADWVMYKGMRKSVDGHASAQTLLTRGRPELSMFWTARVLLDDGVDEILCKCRPDYLREDDVVIDLKTTEDARQRAFERSAFEYRYHVQAAFYTDGIEHVIGRRPRLFVFVAIEKKPPYAIATYFADDRMMAAGRAEYERNLAAYTRCLRDKFWPAYPEEIMPLSLPYWAEKQMAREVV